MNTRKVIALILSVMFLTGVGLAVSDNETVSINVNIEEMCILEINYTPDDLNFVVPENELASLTIGDPLSYVTVYPEDTSGLDVVVKSNSKYGVKLQIYSAGDFSDPALSETIPIAALKWSSDYGSKTDERMTQVPNACFSTSSEGIVTDNITYKLDLHSMDSFGDYQAVIMYTATNLTE
ncbi:hypothetical protein ACFL4D_02395 [Candidatus Margulisiibacteriota bacterium]